MIYKTISMLFNHKRKGMDKPIFVVATLTLAIMFLALYFGAVSGWIDGLVSQFTEATSSFNVTAGDS